MNVLGGLATSMNTIEFYRTLPKAMPKSFSGFRNNFNSRNNSAELRCGICIFRIFLNAIITPAARVASHFFSFSSSQDAGGDENEAARGAQIFPMWRRGRNLPGEWLHSMQSIRFLCLCITTNTGDIVMKTFRLILLHRQVLVGHPLDTIKVRIQTMEVLPGQPPPYKGMVDCASQIIKKEGVSCFLSSSLHTSLLHRRALVSLAC